MAAPVSVRLDDEVRALLESEAQRRKIGLSTLLREIAANAARDVRRTRIREQSEALAAYVETSPEAAEFYDFWGTPRMEG